MNPLEGLAGLIQFITNKEYSLPKRSLIIIGIFLILIVTDNIIGFSYYYNVSQKIDNIQKIESLIKSDSISFPVKEKLKKIQIDLVNHEDLLSRLWSLSSFAISKANSIIAQIIKKMVARIILDRSLWLHVITSCGLIVVSYILAFLLVLLRTKFYIIMLFRMILWLIFIFTISFLLCYYLSKIPVYFNMPLLNYLINFIAQFALYISLLSLFSKIATGYANFEKAKAANLDSYKRFMREVWIFKNEESAS